jgi:MFS family permease
MHRRHSYFWAVTAALGGFLFGFDTAVISGAEQSIQSTWVLSDVMLGQMIAMALYGTILGALCGGIPAQKFGRRTTLLWVAAFFLVSAAGSALAPEIYSLMFFRFIGGLSIGASSVVAPMYISEIAATERRGRLTALFQFNIVLGILIAYLSNYLIGPGRDDSWRWMLGVEVVPAALFLALLLLIPESPRWLIVARGRIEEARRILALVSPEPPDAAIQAIRAVTNPDKLGHVGPVADAWALAREVKTARRPRG